MTDLVIRIVEGYGYLPIIFIDNIEVYRGEFKDSPEEALQKCTDLLKKNKRGT